MSEFNNFQNVLSDGTEVVALGVTSEQNDIVKKIVEGDFSRRYGNYTLEDWLGEFHQPVGEVIIF